jgi:3-deoxy-manno-octulosonate cytidylyltransferase (CMP-KDO synthetase)
MALIGGKPMIQRVYEQALKAGLSAVIVATDHDEIAAVVRDFGGDVVMTSPEAPSGTDRCREALIKLGTAPDVVINIQGDEPFINPAQINALIALFDNKDVEIATLVSPSLSQNEIENPNRVKAVIASTGRALYFSRQPVPFLQGVPFSQWNAFHTYYIHLGIYAYRAKTLMTLGRLPQGTIEKAESLEQLRWLENGYTIFASITPERADSVDTPEDLAAIEKKYFL